MIFQILLTSLLVPKTQNISRELLTTSNVDFDEINFFVKGLGMGK